MLTALLEKKAMFVYKIGMPVVYFYHLLVGSAFLNTAADDARGLEWTANVALAPIHYFFDGKRGAPVTDQDGKLVYTLTPRFDYKSHFFMKAAASAVALPFSAGIGIPLKALSHLSSETRKRGDKLYAARHSKEVISNLSHYRAIGMEIEDYRDSEMIDPPKWKRHPSMKNKLGADVDALKEIVRILSKHEIPFWIDCGSCLGAYQYGGAIPLDWDIDMAFLMPDFNNVKNALQELDPEKYAVQDWSGRAIPNSYLKVLVHETGGLIDIYNFAVDEEAKEVHTVFSNESNIFFPMEWKIRERRYCTPMPFGYVFPLKKALYEGIEVPVPGRTEDYLRVLYGENLAPAKVYNEITDNYEKDLTHPYWQLPSAH